MRNRTNRQWRLRERPEGGTGINDSHLDFVCDAVREVKDGEVLIRTIYLSLDPTNRIWMSDRVQYMPPVEIGAVMRGSTIGVIEESKSPNFEVGSVVSGFWGWQEYSVCGPDMIRGTIKKDERIPLTAYMGLLGAIGCTAYFGMVDIGNPQPGETVVVSAAAGAVGSVAGQIAKIRGCKVIGIAGTKEKCNWIKNELGFDEVVNYKSENVSEALSKFCPDGVDVNFENVGGLIMGDVLSHMNLNGRVALCGLISTYNEEEPIPGPNYFSRILMKRLLVKGFIVTDYLPRFTEALQELTRWLISGQIKYRVDVVEGLDNAALAVRNLFDGSNKGKLMVKVSEEP